MVRFLAMRHNKGIKMACGCHKTRIFFIKRGKKMIQLTMTEDAFVSSVEDSVYNIINDVHFAKLNDLQRAKFAQILERTAWLLESPDLFDDLLNSIEFIVNSHEEI